MTKLTKQECGKLGGLKKGKNFKTDSEIEAIFKSMASKKELGLYDFCDLINIPYQTYISLVRNNKFTPKTKKKLLESDLDLSEEQIETIFRLS